MSESIEEHYPLLEPLTQAENIAFYELSIDSQLESYDLANYRAGDKLKLVCADFTYMELFVDTRSIDNLLATKEGYRRPAVYAQGVIEEGSIRSYQEILLFGSDRVIGHESDGVGVIRQFSNLLYKKVSRVYEDAIGLSDQELMSGIEAGDIVRAKEGYFRRVVDNMFQYSPPILEVEVEDRDGVCTKVITLSD